MKTTIFLFLMICVGPQFVGPVDVSLEEQMIGYWVVEERNGEETVYEQVKRFQDDKAGFSFMKKGKLQRRQNAGWCGTPPITYRNYEGKWAVNDQGFIVLSYEFWGGEMKEVWEVLELKKGKMKVLSKEFETVRKE